MSMIKANAVYYYEVMKWFFNQGDGLWYRISSVTKYILVYGFILGLILRIFFGVQKHGVASPFNPKIEISNRESMPFDEMVFILYFIVLMVYPYQAGGFRFWVPVLPFLFKYIMAAFKTVLQWIKIPRPEIIITALIIAVFIQNLQSAAH